MLWYKAENELIFKIFKYSEPTNNTRFIRSNEAKSVELTVNMTNKSFKAREVDFTNFSIENDRNDMTSPLWNTNRSIEPAGTENKSVKFEPFKTKKI